MYINRHLPLWCCGDSVSAIVCCCCCCCCLLMFILPLILMLCCGGVREFDRSNGDVREPSVMNCRALLLLVSLDTTCFHLPYTHTHTQSHTHKQRQTRQTSAKCDQHHDHIITASLLQASRHGYDSCKCASETRRLGHGQTHTHAYIHICIYEYMYSRYAHSG